MAKIDKVTYRVYECSFSFDEREGLRIFREYYSKNWLGIVTHKSELIAYLPALSDTEFESARRAAREIVSHFKMTTKNLTIKIAK